MNNSIIAISTLGLILAMLPTAIVIGIVYRWSADGGTAVYATLRMLIQLLLIGYVLVYIFEAKHAAIVIAVLLIMLLAASWIAIRPLSDKSVGGFLNALAAISVPGVMILALVTQAVLGVDPWFSPRYLIPLAGMIFAASMNTVSLAAERFQAEHTTGAAYVDARRAALRAALIPVINSLFAVGLVTLPGMMTGQILSGVSPLVAAKYQIMVMSMIFGASGISAALYLIVARRGTYGREVV